MRRDGDAAGAGAVLAVRHDELGGDQVVEQLLDRCFDLAVSGLVAVLELEHDGLGRFSALEPLPDIDRSPLQAEVVAAARD